MSLDPQKVDTGGGDYAEGDVIGQQTTIYHLPVPELTPQEQRNRAAMLERVRLIWINGVLRQSLYDKVRLELGMLARPDAVALPLPAGTAIAAVYDHYGGGLLVIGAPGAATCPAEPNRILNRESSAGLAAHTPAALWVLDH